MKANKLMLGDWVMSSNNTPDYYDNKIFKL